MKKWIFLSVFFSTFGKTNGQFSIPREKFIALLNQGKWDTVYYQCVKMRGEVFGKSALLDYFIAKCLCLDGITLGG